MLKGDEQQKVGKCNYFLSKIFISTVWLMK